jgi:peptidyl-prolyl cis-trans isomerase C
MTRERNVTFLPFVAGLLLVVGCGAVSAAGPRQAADHSAGEPRKVAALVNGEPIYEDQVKPEVEKQLMSFRRYGMRGDGGTMAQRLQTRVLSKLIGNMLVNQESKKRTVENIEEKVDQRVKELEEKYGAGEGMERYLKIRRITMDQLRESLKARVRVDEYLKEQGVLDAEIPEERIRGMYDADPESFSSQDTVTVSHILIAVDEDALPEEKEQARLKAEQIRKEILAGEDFAALAKTQSACHSAAAGGNLGRVKRGFMPPEFDEVAFALENDAVSEVVESKYGFHIIKLVDKNPGGVVPYEQMRDFLRKYLQNEESKKRLDALMVELRKKADVEILLK